MTKLLTVQELQNAVYEIRKSVFSNIPEMGVGEALELMEEEVLKLIQSQKQAHADMVIGEDEAVQYIDDQPATELDEYAEYRNDLRHNQRLRNTL